MRVFMKIHGIYTLPSYDQKTVLAINIHIIDIIAYLSNSCPLNFQTLFDIHSTVAFKSTDPLVLRCHNVDINKLRKLFFFIIEIIQKDKTSSVANQKEVNGNVFETLI